MKKIIPSLIALDVETTGLNPEKGDRIVEIAMVEFNEKGEVISKYVSFINPERNIPDEVMFVHGIDENMLKEAPKFREIADEIKNFIDNKIIVIHNADFDISFLKKEFQLCGYEIPDIKVIDTLYIARKYFNFPNNSLSSLAKYFGIKRIFHRAENDAITAYEIFNQFFENSDIDIEEWILNWNEISSVPIPIERVIENENKIVNAIKEKQEVKIVYVSKDRKATERKIKPIEIIKRNNGSVYLKAFCYLRNEEREFSLDRIIKILDNYK